MNKNINTQAIETLTNPLSASSIKYFAMASVNPHMLFALAFAKK